MRPSDKDPIVAIATAPGRGGVGIVRISGGGSAQVVAFLNNAIRDPESKTVDGNAAATVRLAAAGCLPPARQAVLASFFDGVGCAIDQGLAIRFDGPHSYTGEDVLELQAHGGPVVLHMLLARCLELGSSFGLRLAQPGEFTQRAYLNGKLDLAQAQGVADLIDASTQAAARGAAALLGGALSRRITAMQDALVEVRMWVEANIDFPEEDIDPISWARLSAKLSATAGHIQACLSTSQQGRLLKDGVRVVIAGLPNAGKSSLLNALAGAEVAIVTPIAGTTRDKIEQAIQIEGVPVHLVDTAGLHATLDVVEKIGIERAWAAIEHAHAVLFVHDSTRTDDASAFADAQIQSRLPAQVPVVHVWTKHDIAGVGTKLLHPDAVVVSAKTTHGLEVLRKRILGVAGWQPSGETCFTASERHTSALKRASSHANTAVFMANATSPALDVLAEELRLTHGALGEITGEFTTEDLLGEIFSRFCIGK